MICNSVSLSPAPKPAPPRTAVVTLTMTEAEAEVLQAIIGHFNDYGEYRGPAVHEGCPSRRTLLHRVGSNPVLDLYHTLGAVQSAFAK